MMDKFELIKKLNKYEKALDDIRNVSTLDEYEGANPAALLQTCYEIAKEAKPPLK